MRKLSNITITALLLTAGCYEGLDNGQIDAGTSGDDPDKGDGMDADAGDESGVIDDGDGLPPDMGPDDPMVDAGECGVDGLVQSKRLIRLTFNQQLNSIARLFGPELADQLAIDFDLGDGTSRTFPPLANPREGSIITDSQFQTGDNMARAVADYVQTNFALVSGCGDAPTDACARAWVVALAEQAYRRPLTPDDEQGLAGVYDTVLAEGGTIPEAARYAVYATLISPHFLYRTEFGDDPNTLGRLSPLELASAISYFLADAPPDAELLAAAQSGGLETEAGIRAQVERLIAQPEVRANLESAMFAYFQLGTLSSVVIDPVQAPNFDDGLRASMMREAQEFIKNAMWPGAMTDFLTNRNTIVNERLAAVYGIPYPPPNAVIDADGFAPVALPDNRSGLLTLAGFLTSRSRPDQPSVVGRGLAVNAAFLCAENPPFPEALVDEIEDVEAMLHELSEREKAEYRMETPPCSGCHLGFDPYGLALEQFDIIGQYRETDDHGELIDPSVTLPPNAGGTTVADAAQMAVALSQTEAFSTCMAKNLLAYALAEGGASTTSCATQQLVDDFYTTDGSFTALVTQVALAEAFTIRAAGQGE